MLRDYPVPPHVIGQVDMTGALQITNAMNPQRRIGGALYTALSGVHAPINAVAKVLTGSEEYFWPIGGNPNDEVRAHNEQWERIEAGEEPWPR